MVDNTANTAMLSTIIASIVSTSVRPARRTHRAGRTAPDRACREAGGMSDNLAVLRVRVRRNRGVRGLPGVLRVSASPAGAWPKGMHGYAPSRDRSHAAAFPQGAPPRAA